jgi:ribosomal protein S18 acetylase RimI-like enzyme
MGGVLIRAALPADLPAIGDLRIAAYRADGFLGAGSSYATRLHALGSDGAGEVLAAVEDRVIVGTVMLQPWPHAHQVVRGPGEAEIRALAVAPHERGRGIGRALLSAVTGRAVTARVRHLLLLTEPEMLAAQHLYTEAGFTRLPDRDWSPEAGVVLLAYRKTLAAAAPAAG